MFCVLVSADFAKSCRQSSQNRKIRFLEPT